MIRTLLLLATAVAFLRPLEGHSGKSISDIEGGGGDTRAIRKDDPLSAALKYLLNPFKSYSAHTYPTFLHKGSGTNTATTYKNHSNKYVASGWPLKNVTFNHPIQSPVDLITYKSVTMNLPILDIIEPSLEGVKAKFYNSGHTVYVYIEEDVILRPYLVGGPLNDKFIFEQMHFHWGSEDIWGSEHFINGESFAVEIHLVHFNSKYGSFNEASTKPNGLCVLTIFAEANNTDNALLDPLYELLPNVSEAKTSVLLDSSKAMQWVVNALDTNDEYYTYPGSLTTPPHTENVVFILMPKPINLSHKQLAAFRKLHNEEHGDITDNKRQLQPLHNRPIVRSTNLQ